MITIRRQLEMKSDFAQRVFEERKHGMKYNSIRIKNTSELNKIEYNGTE